MSDIIHGYPIIARFKIPDADGMRKDRQVIMVAKPNEFVVATMCEGDPEWLSGQYINTFKSALDAFLAKIQLEIGFQAAPSSWSVR